jgi:DNA-binding MarR family transcriptional regulator
VTTSPAVPVPAGAERALDLADLVGQAARRLRRGSVAHLGPLGLTLAQARVLRLVGAGPLRMAEIAARLEVVPRTVTSMVDGLESAGLVQRRPDPDDRRSVLVEPTTTGRQLLGQLADARRATAAQVFASLDSKEREQLARLLRRLCAGDCTPGGGR